VSRQKLSRNVALAEGRAVFEIMTICTGNICRSPLAELVLRTRLVDLGGMVHSAGIRGLTGAPMTGEAIGLALARGVAEADARAHRARFLTEQHLVSADLILTMSREHRRAVAELAPGRLRSTFTVREFARLARALSDERIIAAADSADATDAAARLRAASAVIADQRGLALPPSDPTVDDVTDPYRRSQREYELSAAQLDPAIDEVVRVARLSRPRHTAVPD